MRGRGRRLLAEFIGTGLLVCVVVGSGISAQRLFPDQDGLALLLNAVATAGGLFVLILVFQPISGAHINPAVSLVDAALNYRRWSDALSYLPAQFAGGAAGAVLANLMFGLPAFQISGAQPASVHTLLGEVVATAALVLVIFLLARSGRAQLVAPAVAAFIGAAYFFTSSTAFANPAVTVARVLSDTFAGIGPGSAVAFVGAQLIGAALGMGLVVVLAPAQRAAR